MTARGEGAWPRPLYPTAPLIPFCNIFFPVQMKRIKSPTSMYIYINSDLHAARLQNFIWQRLDKKRVAFNAFKHLDPLNHGIFLSLDTCCTRFIWEYIFSKGHPLQKVGKSQEVSGMGLE